MRCLSFVLLALFLGGCVPPVEAPSEMGDLVAWLYTNVQDTDPAVMEAGIDGLDVWLADNREVALETEWEVTLLTEETVDGLDGEDRTVEELASIAVFTESIHTLADAAFAMVGSEIDEVYPDSFSDYTRTWDSDPTCFLNRECNSVSATEDYTASFALGLRTTSRLRNEFLWVEGLEREALVQRNWLVEPPETNSPLLDLDQMYSLNFFIESDVGFIRIQAAWMIVTQGAVNPTAAVTLVGNDYRSNSRTLDAWLEENAP